MNIVADMSMADKNEQQLDQASRRLHEAASQFKGRRREMFDRLLGYQTEKEIAESLGISKHTVHGYAKVIFALCSVHTRKELRVRYAFKQGENERNSSPATDSV